MTLRTLAAAAAFSFSLSAVAQAQPTLPSSTPTASAPVEASQAAAPATASQGTPVKPVGYRTAKYTGGEGATWKTGRDTHGFMGSYGGCKYSGHAGPHGYKIDRVC
ncbi:translation initiation factor IF-2 [uncultured Methylobacterium sp.]|uniref:translation initiation factor IF-2 n=1 Tax=uncultured Methylobacterium sp. TaxID=157278 RepID=UPI0035CA09FC